MDWGRYIDGYCERTDPGYWAEPLNALSNAGFLIAALIMWRRTRRDGLPLAQVLTANLAVIGVGSYLFHAHATLWAAIADVVPIGAFILIFLFAVNLHVWRLAVLPAVAMTALFVPFAYVTIPLFARFGWLGSSAVYGPVPLLIALYAALLWRRAPRVARGLAAGAALLVVNLAFRTIDLPLCAAWPVGTHFVWHALNAVLLGWMIEIYRAHMLAARPVRR